MGESKTLVGVEVKSADQGVALVKFAAYDEVDHHDDVTVKGAFTEGHQVLVSSYNHASWGGALPVGKGTIRNAADGKSAIGELEFFMNTQAGRETFETVKSAGNLQQWSYGYNIEDAEDGELEGKSVRFLKKVSVHEISPVLLGAGKSTSTLAIKNQRDGYDSDKDDDDKKGSNHNKDCPPDCEKNHPKKDSDKDKESGKMRMSDHCIEVLTSVKHLTDRAEEIVALRTAEGKKGLAPDTKVLLDLLADQLERLKRVGVEVVPSEENESVDDALILRSYKNLSEE